MSIAGTNILGTLGSVAGNALTGSQSTGGSISNAGGSNWGYNTAQSINRAQSSGYSKTYGSEASDRAANAAAVANRYQMENMNKAMEFNSKEAQKQREWEERMANTIYTRSVSNMREAGINPILAASMGLSGASVGSGAAASISTPSAFMGQTFADQNSANSSWSAGDSLSHGENGGTWGSSSSSWNNSESGLATGLKQMANLTSGIVDQINGAMALKENETYLDKIGESLKEHMKNDNNKNDIEKMFSETGNVAAYYLEKFNSFMKNSGMGALTPFKWNYLANDILEPAKKIFAEYYKRKK